MFVPPAIVSGELNVFSGVLRSSPFCAVTLFTLAVQLVMVGPSLSKRPIHPNLSSRRDNQMAGAVRWQGHGCRGAPCTLLDRHDGRSVRRAPVECCAVFGLPVIRRRHAIEH